jgi:hypothetical protein
MQGVAARDKTFMRNGEENIYCSEIPQEGTMGVRKVR